MSTEQSLVFVVDDDASARDGIEDLLQSVGLPVMSFGSGQEFLHGPRSDAPGCIVLDVRLPGTGGLEFQKVLVEAGVLLRVIFITGHGDIPMPVIAMKSGAIEFLTKPHREQSLLDALNAGIEADRLEADRLRRQGSKHVSELRQRFDAGDLDRRPGPNGEPSRLLRRESQDLNQSTRRLVPTLGVGSTSAQLPPSDRAFNMHSRIGGVNAEFGLNHRR